MDNEDRIKRFKERSRGHGERYQMRDSAAPRRADNEPGMKAE